MMFRTRFLREMGLLGKPMNFPSLRSFKKGLPYPFYQNHEDVDLAMFLSRSHY